MTILYQANFDSQTTGVAPTGWTAITGTWQVGFLNPISGTHSFYNPANGDGNIAVYTAGSTATTDQNFQVSWSYPNTTTSLPCPGARCSADGQNGYFLLWQPSTTKLIIFRRVTGTYTNIANAVVAGITAGNTYNIEVSAVGTTISGRIWQRGTQRPSAAQVSVTDSSLTAGTAGLYYVGLTSNGACDDVVWTDATSIGAVFPVDTANVTWSPYNWDTLNVSDFGVTLKSMQTTACGAYIKFSATNTTSFTLGIDTFPLIGFGTNTPKVAWSVDTGPLQSAQLTVDNMYLNLASGLTLGTHTIEVWLFGSVETQGSRWGSAGVSPTNVLRINGLGIDSGGSITAFPLVRPKKAAFFGDSIVEGVRAAGTTTEPADHARSSAWFACIALNCEYGVLGYGATGWEQAGNGNVPAFPSSWNLYSASRSRTLSGADYVFVMHGYNGTAVASDITNWITAARADAGPQAWIFVVNAPSGKLASVQIAGVNAYLSANPSDTKVASIDYSDRIRTTSFNNVGGPGFLESTDGVHPLEWANGEIGSAIASKVQTVLSSGSTGSTVIDLGGGFGMTTTGSAVVIL